MNLEFLLLSAHTYSIYIAIIISKKRFEITIWTQERHKTFIIIIVWLFYKSYLRNTFSYFRVGRGHGKEGLTWYSVAPGEPRGWVPKNYRTDSRDPI